MSHKAIIIDNISLVMDKVYFEYFNARILAGRKIAIIGSNGTGKTALLKLIQHIIKPTAGTIVVPDQVTFGYVPQTITEYEELSGGQRFNKKLSQALSTNPDILLLDEPTNHLDAYNKQSLMRMVQHYEGTLLLVCHDPDVLALDFDEIWHIEHCRINIFNGNYLNYLIEQERKREYLEQEHELLHKEHRTLKKLVQKEHRRSAQSRKANKNENDRNLLGAMKESGSRTSGKELKRLHKEQKDISNKLSTVYIYKKIEPTFAIDTHKLASGKAIISIRNGSCGYNEPIISDISFQLLPTEHSAIIGDNGRIYFFKSTIRQPNY